MFTCEFKKPALVLSLLLLVSLTAACSSIVPTQEPVTITFAHPEDVTGAYAQWAAQFHDRYPNITVELKSFQDVGSARAEQDVFMASQMELPFYVREAQVVDLSSFMEQDADLNAGDLYPAALEAFRGQGRQWALPFGIDMMVVYFNKDLFDRYGAPYPTLGWDWGDFLDAAIVTTDADEDIYGYALQYFGDYGVFEPVMFIYQGGGQIFDSLQSPSRVILDDPANIQAMEFYASLIHRHGVAPPPEEMGRIGTDYPWRGIAAGNFAMWSTLLSDHGGLRWPVAWEMTWGVVPMPRNETAASFGISEGLFMSTASEHPDEAWLWMKFLSRQVHPFQMPARRSLAESTIYEDYVGPEVALAARAALEDAVLVNPELLGFEVALGAMMEAFEQIRSGEASPEIALQAAQEKSGF